MNIEKLQKLNELKEKGILTEEEFNIQKNELLNETENTTSKAKTSPILTVIGVVFILSIVISNSGKFYWSIPKCDNENLLKTDLISTIENMPLFRLAGVRPIYVEMAIENSYDETRKKRYCTASVKLSNTASVDIDYTLEDRSGQIYIEASLKKLNNLLEDL